MDDELDGAPGIIKNPENTAVVNSKDESGLESNQGYMFKQTTTKSWLRRYFWINNGFLVYSTREGGVASGAVDLSRVSSVALVDEDSFDLVLEDRNYSLRAPTVEDADKWMSVLERRVDWARERRAARLEAMRKADEERRMKQRREVAHVTEIRAEDVLGEVGGGGGGGLDAVGPEESGVGIGRRTSFIANMQEAARETSGKIPMGGGLDAVSEDSDDVDSDAEEKKKARVDSDEESEEEEEDSDVAEDSDIEEEEEGSDVASVGGVDPRDLERAQESIAMIQMEGKVAMAAKGHVSGEGKGRKGWNERYLHLVNGALSISTVDKSSGEALRADMIVAIPLQYVDAIEEAPLGASKGTRREFLVILRSDAPMMESVDPGETMRFRVPPKAPASREDWVASLSASQAAVMELGRLQEIAERPKVPRVKKPRATKAPKAPKPKKSKPARKSTPVQKPPSPPKPVAVVSKHPVRKRDSDDEDSDESDREAMPDWLEALKREEDPAQRRVLVEEHVDRSVWGGMEALDASAEGLERLGRKLDRMTKDLGGRLAQCAQLHALRAVHDLVPVYDTRVASGVRAVTGPGGREGLRECSATAVIQFIRACESYAATRRQRLQETTVELTAAETAHARELAEDRAALVEAFDGIVHRQLQVIEQRLALSVHTHLGSSAERTAISHPTESPRLTRAPTQFKRLLEPLLTMAPEARSPGPVRVVLFRAVTVLGAYAQAMEKLVRSEWPTLRGKGLANDDPPDEVRLAEICNDLAQIDDFVNTFADGFQQAVVDEIKAVSLDAQLNGQLEEVNVAWLTDLPPKFEDARASMLRARSAACWVLSGEPLVDLAAAGEVLTKLFSPQWESGEQNPVKTVADTLSDYFNDFALWLTPENRDDVFGMVAERVTEVYLAALMRHAPVGDARASAKAAMSRLFGSKAWLTEKRMALISRDMNKYLMAFFHERAVDCSPAMELLRNVVAALGTSPDEVVSIAQRAFVNPDVLPWAGCTYVLLGRILALRGDMTAAQRAEVLNEAGSQAMLTIEADATLRVADNSPDFGDPHLDPDTPCPVWTAARSQGRALRRLTGDPQRLWADMERTVAKAARQQRASRAAPSDRHPHINVAVTPAPHPGPTPSAMKQGLDAPGTGEISSVDFHDFLGEDPEPAGAARGASSSPDPSSSRRRRRGTGSSVPPISNIDLDLRPIAEETSTPPFAAARAPPPAFAQPPPPAALDAATLDDVAPAKPPRSSRFVATLDEDDEDVFSSRPKLDKAKTGTSKRFGLF